MRPNLLQCFFMLLGSFVSQLFRWHNYEFWINIGIVAGGFIIGYPIMALLNGFRNKPGTKISHYDWLLYRLWRWRWNPILDRNPAMKEMMIAWLKASDVVDNGTEVKVTVTIEPNNV
jgi:hypothetical protein